MAIGVEMADAATAREIGEEMRQAGVLIGITGRARNTLKIRPPLVFRREHADQLLAELQATAERRT